MVVLFTIRCTFLPPFYALLVEIFQFFLRIVFLFERVVDIFIIDLPKFFFGIIRVGVQTFFSMQLGNFFFDKPIVMTRFFFSWDGIPKAEIDVKFFGIEGIKIEFGGLVIRAERADPDGPYVDLVEKEFLERRSVFDGNVHVLDHRFSLGK